MSKRIIIRINGQTLSKTIEEKTEESYKLNLKNLNNMENPEKKKVPVKKT